MEQPTNGERDAPQSPPEQIEHHCQSSPSHGSEASAAPYRAGTQEKEGEIDQLVAGKESNDDGEGEGEGEGEDSGIEELSYEADENSRPTKIRRTDNQTGEDNEAQQACGQYLNRMHVTHEQARQGSSSNAQDKGKTGNSKKQQKRKASEVLTLSADELTINSEHENYCVIRIRVE
ncbi:hypothetical protein HWV62_37805 [Athelia sp. TMB]|nr:hypothetical protein HWV62_37805 [Athelia sp. TMB]